MEWFITTLLILVRELNRILPEIPYNAFSARGREFLTVARYIILGIAAIPWIYYVLVLYSTVRILPSHPKKKILRILISRLSSAA